MMEFYVVYDTSTGFEDGGHGLADTSETPDGSTRAEWIQRALAKKVDRAVAYFPEGTTFDPETQKIEADAIVDQTPQEISDRDKVKSALRRMRGRDIELFRMVLAVWGVGITKGLWTNPDLPADIRQMAQDWLQDLADLGY